MRRIHRVAVLAAALAAAPGVAPRAFADQPLRELSRKDIRTRTQSLSPPLAREIGALQYVLRPQEMAVLLSVPAEDRCRRWIEQWWADHDPDFTTPENEAREAHEDRVLSARAYFGCGPWPGWDDRGEALIRYGLPAFSEYAPAAVVEPGIYVPAQVLWY